MNQNKTAFKVYLVCLVLFIAATLLLSVSFLSDDVAFAAEVILDAGIFKLPSTIEGNGVHFEIADSEYLNITLNSSEEIKLKMESIPEMVTMMIEPVSSAASTQITISGFLPNITYYKYQDDYHNLTEFVADNNGIYSYAQDISTPHFVFIQPRKSTKFIKDDATGGDCYLIGNWDNAAKTCVLISNIYETIQIDNDNIIFDGAGHSLIGTGTGSGIFLYRRTNLTIKNLNISKFYNGIYLYQGSNNVVQNNNFYLNNYIGIYSYFSRSNVFTNNSADSNFYGLFLDYSGGNILSNNQMTNNRYNFGVFGQPDFGYDNNIDVSNLVDGKPIYYIHNAANQIYDETINAGAFYCVNCDNIIVDGLLLTKNWVGLMLINTTNSTVQNVNAVDNSFGIYLFNSNINTLISNNVDNNNYGFYFRLSDGNNLTNNSADFNNYYGITLFFSKNDYLSDNNAANNYYGIYLFNAEDNIIIDNNFTLNSYGAYVNVSRNNKIYNNNFINNSASIFDGDSLANIYNLFLPTGGNYWSNYDTYSEGCADLNNNNICDSPYNFYWGQDNLPWKIENGWVAPQNQPPTISDLNQYKSDGQMAISESGITTESTADNPNESIVVFKATLQDQNNDQVKLQVELKEAIQLFTGTNFLESGFIASGSNVTIERRGLFVGQYKWRARAIDDKSNASDWQEFGVVGNIDFEVKLVPLYTQVRSPYPSIQDTESWFDLDYADGNASCGSKIYQCGCAIASSVMILRYYGVTNINNEDVNPGNINDWLNANSGYQGHGVLDWQAVARYSDYQIDFDTVESGNYFNDYIKLTGYLGQNQPAIAKEASGRGGIEREHFIVIDNKLAATYGVKDPYWYNTRYLNEITDSVNKRRSYENGFDGLRLFYPGDGIADASVSLNLASPAEFLITDPLGRKYGKDPITNIEYKEIPSATYFTENIDDATGELPPANHENKSFYIQNPLDGRYVIKIIGTDYGNYTFDSTVYDIQGQIHPKTFVGNTDVGISASYNLNYDSQYPENISIQPEDIEPPVIFHTSINSDYILNSSPISFEFSAYDSGVGLFNLSAKLDGVSILSGQIINFDAIANHIIEIIAVDYLGNVSAEIIDFNVVYNFGGFLPPIKSDSSGIYKLGGTLPIKFQLTDADNQFISTAVAKLYVAKISDGIIGTDEIPLSTSNADAGNIFRSETNQYIYNLSTDNLSLGTWRLKVVLDDGNHHTVIVSFK